MQQPLPRRMRPVALAGLSDDLDRSEPHRASPAAKALGPLGEEAAAEDDEDPPSLLEVAQRAAAAAAAASAGGARSPGPRRPSTLMNATFAASERALPTFEQSTLRGSGKGDASRPGTASAGT